MNGPDVKIGLSGTRFPYITLSRSIVGGRISLGIHPAEGHFSIHPLTKDEAQELAAALDEFVSNLYLLEREERIQGMTLEMVEDD